MSEFENYDPAKEKARLRKEAMAEAEKIFNLRLETMEEDLRSRYDLSQSRWDRFLAATVAVLVAGVVIAFLWWLIGAMLSSTAASEAEKEERLAWDRQCQIEGGIVAYSTDTDLKFCLIDGRVARTRAR